MISPLGTLCLAASQEGLIRVDLQQGERPIQPVPAWQEEAHVLTDARGQREEYFQGKCRHFTLRLAPKGTLFQQRVWQELLRIPYGATIAYTELARRLGNLRAVRAVGRANGRDSIAIIMPCHRAIGRDGRLPAIPIYLLCACASTRESPVGLPVALAHPADISPDYFVKPPPQACYEPYNQWYG
jgi:methylated-DNA-[protein]-cysteine S-methyltransferase